MSGSHRSARDRLYGCLAYLKRGTSVCGNSLRLPIERVDNGVLQALSGDVLRPRVVMAVIERVLREFEPEAVERDVERIRAELQALERELANLTRAIAVGGELEPLLAELSARQDRHRGLRAKLADWEAGSIRRLDRQVIEGKVRTYLEHWRGLLTSHVQDGRQSPRECSQVR